jgi:hypothetical protein
MTRGIPKDGVRRPAVSVVEIVLLKENEVSTATLSKRRIIGAGRPHMIPAVTIVTPETNVTTVCEEKKIIVPGSGGSPPKISGRVEVHRFAVLAVVHGVTSLAVSHTPVMEGCHGHRHSQDSDHHDSLTDAFHSTSLNFVLIPQFVHLLMDIIRLLPDLVKLFPDPILDLVVKAGGLSHDKNDLQNLQPHIKPHSS